MSDIAHAYAVLYERHDALVAEVERLRAVIAVPDPPRKPLLYMAHPVAPTADELERLDASLAREVSFGMSAEQALDLRVRTIARGIEANLRRARRWLRWFSVNAPSVVVIAPWIAAVQSVLEAGVEERAERAREMAVCRDVASRCDAVAQVGGRVSSGMADEGAAARRVVDLTAFGEEPPEGDAAARLLLAIEVTRG